MSDQHQTAGKPAKPERRVEHHRERQAARAALNVSDLEDVLDPPSVHNTAAPGLPRPVEAKPRSGTGSSRSGSGAAPDGGRAMRQSLTSTTSKNKRWHSRPDALI
jgi:hypothetical protein